MDLSDDEVSEIKRRYIFQETLNNVRENKLDDGARPLLFDSPCKIRIKKLGDTPYTFPLSNACYSRIICEHGVPLFLSNKYDFLWKKDHQFTAVRSSTLEQLHLNRPYVNTHLDLNLHKLIMFGPCSQTNISNFDDQLFVYLVTVLVFLPSHYIGGNNRFIDDDNIHRHVFHQHDSDN